MVETLILTVLATIYFIGCIIVHLYKLNKKDMEN